MFLERYRNGEREAVWAGLQRLGPNVRHPDSMRDAEDVAAETMRRARQNIETLIVWLEKLGYCFLRRQPWVPPAPDVHQNLAALEEYIKGPIPLSIRAWCEIVGEVCLDGSHEVLEERPGKPSLRVHMGGDMMDGSNARLGVIYEPSGLPLQIEPWINEWRDLEPEDDPEDEVDPYEQLMLTAIGGESLGVKVPNAAADARFGRRYFVEHLRHAFRWGGFPGYADTLWKPTKELDYLAEGLLPI
jgi:hypothetical protein